MWQYLIRLKRMQLRLDTAWAVLHSTRLQLSMNDRSTSRLSLLPEWVRTGLWQMRQRMGHFFTNMLMYIQVCACACACVHRCYCS